MNEDGSIELSREYKLYSSAHQFFITLQNVNHYISLSYLKTQKTHRNIVKKNFSRFNK